ncbi:MAG: transporter, family, 3-phenylpropionic acid transporter [Clostridiales bacterium]|jgi:PPP family 3-phenylpropionic acid transporter|nr:transporter, family, 3-phenylpropionic acid transporter [Clostridiales bacterium]
MEERNNYLYYFISFYALSYMVNAVYGTFMPVYLDHIGYGQTAIGTLLALGPFIAMIAQPVWGIAGDRAKAKNIILQILLLGSAISIIMYPLSQSFYYLVFIMAMYTFFQTSIGPLIDAITLEYIEKTHWKFGLIRMAGTIGFAVMSVVAGAIAKRYIGAIFVLCFAVIILNFIISFFLPKVKGYQFNAPKVPIWELFKNRELVLLMIFNLIIQTTLGFYYAFFPIYFRNMGGDNALLGWAMFISAMSEIPFLLFADKILNKIGVYYTLLGSGIVAAVRWLILHFVTNPYVVLPLQALHGLIFIVLSIALATYINREVPKALRASGQTMNGLIGMGLSRIIGSMLGGTLSDMVGIRQVFLYSSLLAFATVAAFGFIFAKGGRHSQA